MLSVSLTSLGLSAEKEISSVGVLSPSRTVVGIRAESTADETSPVGSVGLTSADDATEKAKGDDVK